tara:strand:+ start:1005 stop:1136 length:132 start_codon:yes stop_codon:yes gene_type:complete
VLGIDILIAVRKLRTHAMFDEVRLDGEIKVDLFTDGDRRSAPN